MIFIPYLSTSIVPLPLAASEAAETAVFELTRLESLRDSPWTLLALVGGLLLLLAYVWWFYRRESQTISIARTVVLALLRTTAIAGLVAFFLGIERRTSTQVVEPSRVAVLVDTSLSMDLPADDPTLSNNPVSRGAAAQMLLAASPLIEELRDQHDVDLVGFGESSRPAAYLPQRMQGTDGEPASSPNATDASDDAISAGRLSSEFQAIGHETRLGDALAATLERYRGLPLAGVVLLTDGGQNRGLEPAAAAEAAAAARVRVHSVGFGAMTAPANVAVRELIAPERAYPGDKLTLQAIVHLRGLAGQQCEMQLNRRTVPDSPADDAPGAWELLATQTLSVEGHESLETVRFETNPAEAGNYIYELRALPSPREVLKDDNTQQAEVSVVDRQTRVLLYAGGPTARLPFCPQPIAARPKLCGRRTAWQWRTGHFAGRQRNPDRIPRHRRATLQVRRRRGIRSELV